MIAISSSTSQTATTLAKALAKLAADEAAKAPAKIIAAYQATVTQFENSPKPSPQDTAVELSAGSPMKRFAALVVILTFGLAACSPESETTGSINSCAKELFANYSPKVLDQCVAACRKCDHGTTVTCTTSCTLKGAH